MTRQQIFALVLGEAAIVGLISSVIGVLLGIVIGRGLVDLINSDYHRPILRRVGAGRIHPGMVSGEGRAAWHSRHVGSGLHPSAGSDGSASEGGAVPLALGDPRFRGTMPLASIIGLGVIGVGIGLVLLPVRTLILSFLGLAALILGGALLTPAIVILFGRALAPALGGMFGSLGAMAARGIAASISRTAVAIAALSVAISVTISIDTMVHSFRDTVEQWLESSLGLDIYIFAGLSALVSD